MSLRFLLSSLPIAAALALACAVPASAGDYAHQCSSANGLYVMQDDGLYEAEAVRRGDWTEIKYKTTHETTLEDRQGYCVSNAAEAQGAKFSYRFRRYLRTIRFEHQGSQIEETLLCELSASGLPAAFGCDRDVETVNYSAAISGDPPPAEPQDATEPESRQTTLSLWDHNGSVMRLVADGPSRAFVYEKPRKGMQAAGVRKGVVLFRGKREGKGYSGTAYVFSRECGPRAFPVTGTVAADDRQVTLTGTVATLDGSCRASGSRTETLSFSLLGN